MQLRGDIEPIRSHLEVTIMTIESPPATNALDSVIVNIHNSLFGTPIKMAKVERSPKNIWGERPLEFFTIMEHTNSKISIFRLTTKCQWCGVVWNDADDMNRHVITSP